MLPDAVPSASWCGHSKCTGNPPAVRPLISALQLIMHACILFYFFDRSFVHVVFHAWPWVMTIKSSSCGLFRVLSSGSLGDCNHKSTCVYHQTIHFPSFPFLSSRIWQMHWGTSWSTSNNNNELVCRDQPR